ncbi:MAG: alpha/beta hydrolase [Hyphomicrobiaceae bacterium]
MSDRSTFDKGSRTGFLLFPGLGGTPAELRYVSRGLARAGYTVYCCQLAGHGTTYEALRRSTWKEWHESARTALRRLRSDCDVVIAGGLSTGALVALHLAHEQPADIQGLVLYAPSLRLDGWAMPWYMDLLHLIRPTPIPIELTMPEREPFGLKDKRIRQLVLQSMLSGDPSEAGLWGTPLRTFANFNSLAARVKRELRSIAAPTLILHPREDDVASLRNAFLIQERLAGLAELVVLDDSYHIITLDRQRALVVDRSARFAELIERQHAVASQGERAGKQSNGPRVAETRVAEGGSWRN